MLDLDRLFESPDRDQALGELQQALERGGDSGLAAAVSERLQQYALFLGLTKTLSGSLSLDVLLPELVEIVTKILGAERATLFLLDDKTCELYSRVAVGEGVEEIRIPCSAGIAGAAYEEDRALSIPDAYQDPRFNPEVDKRTGFRTRNILCAPLRNRTGRAIGVTQVLNKRAGSFDPSDMALLETLTLQASTTLEHARLFDALDKSRQEQGELMELMEAISDELHLPDLLAKIVEGSTRLLDAERGTFFLYDSKSDELWSLVAEGLQNHEIRIPSDQGIAGWAFSKADVVNIPDAYADSRFDPAVDRATGYRTRTILSLPVRNKLGRITGVMQLLNKREGAFGERDVGRLKAFSSLAATAVENAQLFHEVLELKNFNEGILKSLTNGVVTLDGEGQITKMNEAAARILALGEDDIVGRSALGVFSNGNPWVVKSLDYVTQTGKTDFHLDTDFLRGSGDTVSVNLHLTPLFSVEGEPVGSMMVFEDITREKRVRSTMARYLAKEVVDQLLASEDDVLAGKDHEATVLFSDIRRFTSISEKLGTRETVTMLNEYFTEMVDVVLGNGGMLDKYIGDAIMAVFGAPVVDARDAERALTVATEMLVRLRHFNARRAQEGYEPIEIGIGVSTGEVMSGSVGSVKRMEYTVIGDTVNLAARLESANKFYGTKVLLNATTVAQLPSRKAVREVDSLRVKGIARPLAIYESFAHDPPDVQAKMRLLAPHYRQGLAEYRAGRWRKAIDAFEAGLAHLPLDGPSLVLRDRCFYYWDNPPGEAWDGVWTPREK